MLSEISQTRKDKYRTKPLTQGRPRIGKFIDGSIEVIRGCGEEGMGNECLMSISLR